MYYLNRSQEVLYFLLPDPAREVSRADVLHFNETQTEFDFLGTTAELKDLLEFFPELDYQLWKHLKTRLRLLDKVLSKPYTEGKEELFEQRDGLLTAFIRLQE